VRRARRTRDDAELGLGLECVQHLDDVLVAQLAQDLDLLLSRVWWVWWIWWVW
jgi:hypothetical protein